MYYKSCKLGRKMLEGWSLLLKVIDPGEWPMVLILIIVNGKF